MIALLLAALASAASAAPAPDTILPPPDWSALPALTLIRPPVQNPATSLFVRDEVVQGRCGAAVRSGTGWTLDVDVAVLAAGDGRVRRIVPRAIGCPTVEQYAAGLMLSNARDNIEPLPGDAEHWYRTRLTFSWVS